MPPSTTFSVQTPDRTLTILNAYRAVAKSTQFSRVSGLYAFATTKGARLLCAALAESKSWQRARKRWVISIDDGITEPEALRYLLSMPRTEVLVPYSEKRLRQRLAPSPRFHPKTLLLEGQAPRFRPIAMLVGSANLTCNGLCFGHEHVLAIRFRSGSSHLPAAVSDGLAALAGEIAGATKIDTRFVDRYSKMRPRRIARVRLGEDAKVEGLIEVDSVVPGPLALALATSAHMWVEVDYVVANRGAGKEGNQIDLQRGSRVFFGFPDKAIPRNSPIGTVRIIFGTHASERNLRFGNNSMDKLDLPIPGEGGPSSYATRTLLFTRTGSGFRMEVGSASDINAWKAASRANDTLIKMRGGREFGVF